MPRFLKLLLIILVIGVLLCACTGEKAAPYDISEYLSAFTAMDYAAMFACTEPVADLDSGKEYDTAKDTFVSKYKAIFSGLGVTHISIDTLNGPDESGTYTYTATYKTKDYGDFTNNFTLHSRVEEGKCYVLWDYSLIFPEMEAGCSVLVRTLTAQRGEIFAADGTLLAANSFADTIYMDVTKVQDIKAVASVVSPITGLTESEIVDKFNSAVENEYNVVSLGAYFKNELTDTQRASILAVPGLGIDNKLYTPIRDYPMGAAAAHIVGYTQFADEEDLEAGYSTSDRKGVTGLEASYESALRGKDGKIVFIQNRWGDNIRTLWEDPMEEGQDLRTTIDPRLQQEAYDALSQNLDLAAGEKGIAIVMDASTGHVQAMVSYPSYDDNIFTFPLSKTEWDTLNNDVNDPLYPRATRGLYPPGSVIKPFTATAALESGAITPESVFTDPIVANKWEPEGKGWTVTRIDDSGTPLKLLNALTKSDNIFFAWAALQMGQDTYLNYLSRIGFEEAVPFDLSVGEANLVDSTMSEKMLADMGYGQGELLVAPIQIAAMYTGFANGTGNMMQPIMVEKLCRTEGLDYVTVEQHDPAVWKENAISQNSLNTLEPMLEAVVSSGSGKPVRIPGITIAGKTGTAEKEGKAREASWFAGYWVDGSYDRLVIVMVDVAEGEGSVKFEIAKRLLMP